MMIIKKCKRGIFVYFPLSLFSDVVKATYKLAFEIK